MKVLGVIPARGGSKGVPNKNIRDLAGKPLIGFTIEETLKSGVDEVIVSTDSLMIADIAQQFGARVPFIRPLEISGDNAKSIDVALHALEEMENIDSCLFDAIVVLQPTTPFRSSDDIRTSINLLIDNPDADSVISVVNVGAHHPARMKFIENGVLIDPTFCEDYENQNRQELTPMYIRNGAIYLTRRETLISGSYKGKKCLAYEMPPIRSSNIDTMYDFELAEFVYNKFLK
jgi:CMP-N-acetylneuraminic acid synthetase